MHLGSVAALGTCTELESAMPGGGIHSLNEVFTHFAGTIQDSGGTLRGISAERMTAQRLG